MRLISSAVCLLLFLCCNEKRSSEASAMPGGSESAAEGKGVPAGADTSGLLGEADPVASILARPGGSFRTWGSEFPKSLNYFLDNNSFSAEVTGLMFEALVGLHSTENKPVGILAQSWDVSEDQRTFTFRIHPSAAWSDGRPVTAEDVQFYYDVIMDPKNLTSLFRVGLKRFERPEIVDERTVRVHAKEAHWKNFYEAGGMYAFPKHVWNGLDFNKQNFDFSVVSGPYKIGEVKKNRYVLMKRRSDWWGRVSKYNQHKYNFEEIKYKFISDRTKALEAFKKGDFDAYAIYTSSIWMMQTDFDQVKKGWVRKHKVYNREPKGFQGMAVNLRLPKFQDVRVREALCYLLNRELMNEKLMYNQYFLLDSYYPDLYPNNDNPDIPLRGFDPEKARRLLKEAGWIVSGQGVLEKDGQPLEITFITASEDQRHLNIYLEDLKKVGIQANIEKLSWSSIRKRLDKHDYDMYWIAWGASRLRDPESVWHSSTADQEASNNIPGVKDAFIDSLIELQKLEPSIDKRNDILRAIDKRLHEIIPYVLLWQADHNRILFWDRYGTPPYIFGKYSREEDIIAYWWLDEQKDNALKAARAAGTPLPIVSLDVRYEE